MTDDFVRQHNELCNACDNNTVDFLNDEISRIEIFTAIDSLINGKAAGNDGIVGEMLKISKYVPIPHLFILFNNNLESGIYPNGWCEAILCPLHKNGSVNEVGNYRGISLLPVLSKVFTKILNDRLVKWAENHNLQKEEQAGYRKNYSTIDQIFSLQPLCQKYITKKKGRFYVLFIDFTKAFDTIPHNLLWYKLIKSGVHGKLLKVLNSMYSNLKSYVRTHSGLTEYFQCTVGTRQGCMLSPFLFTLYISELVDMMKNEGCQSVYVDKQNPNILMFMYADDIASGTDTVSRMQKILNVLSKYCKKWGLIVSIAKTKILVFRRGGKI